MVSWSNHLFSLIDNAMYQRWFDHRAGEAFYKAFQRWFDQEVGEALDNAMYQRWYHDRTTWLETSPATLFSRTSLVNFWIAAAADGDRFSAFLGHITAVLNLVIEVTFLPLDLSFPKWCVSKLWLYWINSYLLSRENGNPVTSLL